MVAVDDSSRSGQDTMTNNGPASKNQTVSGQGQTRGSPVVQLFRPANTSEEVRQFLVRTDLNDSDIVDFLSGKDLPPVLSTSGKKQVDESEESPETDEAGPTNTAKTAISANASNSEMRAAFRQRGIELRRMREQLAAGATRIDEDGRLVVTEPPQPPRAVLPPPPVRGEQNRNNRHLLQNQDGNDIQFLRQQQAPAAANGDDVQNLTFRRICFAVLAVVTAFVCVILQTLPLLQPSEAIDPNFDQLLHELLEVRSMKHHLQQCPGLHRDAEIIKGDSLADRGITFGSSWTNWIPFQNGRSLLHKDDCDFGVLHLPSKHVLESSYLHSAPEEAKLLEPYRSALDIQWSLPCYQPPDRDGNQNDTVSASHCYPGWGLLNSTGSTCMAETNSSSNSHECRLRNTAPDALSNANQCFRGVHDGIITKEEVEKSIRVGNGLILNGGDHFDIYYDTSYLQKRIPSVLDKLRKLLKNQYGQAHLHPVAFRVHAAGPMDFHGVNLYHRPALALNQTNYLQWVEQSERINKLAQFSLPWPFRIQPRRDTCNLMADMELDPRFAVQTSVFLTGGAGLDYRGGVSLYIDHHQSNYEPKQRIQRGVTIDGSLGRVIVSTGGIENRQCRMPTRAGLRVVLQIWWGCAY